MDSCGDQERPGSSRVRSSGYRLRRDPRHGERIWRWRTRRVISSKPAVLRPAVRNRAGRC